MGDVEEKEGVHRVGGGTCKWEEDTIRERRHITVT